MSECVNAQLDESTRPSGQMLTHGHHRHSEASNIQPPLLLYQGILGDRTRCSDDVLGVVPFDGAADIQSLDLGCRGREESNRMIGGIGVLFRLRFFKLHDLFIQILMMG